MRRVVGEKPDDGDSLRSEFQARGAQVVEHRPGSLPTAFHLAERNENHSNRQGVKRVRRSVSALARSEHGEPQVAELAGGGMLDDVKSAGIA